MHEVVRNNVTCEIEKEEVGNIAEIGHIQTSPPKRMKDAKTNDKISRRESTDGEAQKVFLLAEETEEG